MRKSKKNWLNITVIAVMCLAIVLAGCSSGSKDSAATPAASDNKAAVNKDPFGKYATPVNLTVARDLSPTKKFLPGEDLTNNSWIKLYASQLGINVTYAFTATAEGNPSAYIQKLNANIASGSLPDVFQVDARQLAELSAAGKLADLTQAWADFASPEVKENFNRDGGLALKSATFSGKLNAVPVLKGGNLGQARMVWIRTDWLKKLNLPEPKTMQDLLNIAEAFTTKDPDGNGKSDTYGIGFNKTFFSANFGTEAFFQGYRAYPQLWVKDSAGKLQYGSTMPEMKKGLTTLQDLYKKGIIDKEFAVKDTNNMVEDVSQNKVGILSGLNWICYTINPAIQKNPNMDWKPFPILSADDKPALAGVPNSINMYVVAKKGISNPEALVKMVNVYFQKFNSTSLDDYHTYMTDKADPTMNLFDNAATTSMIPINFDLTIAKNLREAFDKKSPDALKPDAKVYYGNIEKFFAGDRTMWATNKQRGLKDSAYNIWQEYDKKYMDAEFYGAPTPTMIDKLATLQKLEVETFTKIVMGNATVDSFDKFVTDWKNLGGEAMTKEVNDWKATQK
jgi:putative aldouronate transport system substrate-binding protein